MSDLIKLDMTQIWATNGDKIQPSDAKVAEGWIVEAVPRQTWNWMQNRVEQNVAYMLQKGIPEWDSTTEYQNNKSYVQRNGVVYKCTVTGVNLDPAAANNTNWVKAFPEWTQALEALRNAAPVANTLPYYDTATSAKTTPLTAYARTLLATATAAAARGVLDAQQANVNLTALSALGGVNNTFPYFTGTNTFGLATVTGFSRTLLGQQDAATWRSTLGLKGAAIMDVSSTNAPSTAGLITKVGDYGWGVGSNGMAAMDIPSDDINLATLSGVYRVTSATTNVLAGYGQGAMVITVMWNNATGHQILTQNNRMAIRQGSSLNTTPVWNGWTEMWSYNNMTKTATSNDSTVGRMLKVGDFGIGAQGVLVGDINLLSGSGNGNGIYKLGSPYTGSPVANTPCSVIHMAYDNERTQVAIVEGGSAVREFIRKYSAGAWGAWVEIYHTGNTSAIVTQVTNNIQPTLNTKVSKSGDTMTGALTLPSLEVGTGGGQGYIDFHDANSTTDYDARIITDTKTNTAGGGRLIYYAASNYFSGNVTVVGNFNTGAGAQFGGSASVNGGLTVTSDLVAASGVGSVTLTNGRVLIRPANNDNAQNGHVYFLNADGGTRGLIYTGQSGNMTVQAGGQVAAVFYADGHTGLNNITTNTIQASGQISSTSGINANGRVSGSDVLSSGVVYAGGGAVYFQGDGNIIGGMWNGGALSTHIYNVAVQRSELMANLAAQPVFGLGTYIFAGGPAANAGDGISGSQLRASSVNSVAGSTLPGNWRCMGYSSNGSATLWMRYQ